MKGANGRKLADVMMLLVNVGVNLNVQGFFMRNLFFLPILIYGSETVVCGKKAL